MKKNHGICYDLTSHMKEIDHTVEDMEKYVGVGRKDMKNEDPSLEKFRLYVTDLNKQTIEYVKLVKDKKTYDSENAKRLENNAKYDMKQIILNLKLIKQIYPTKEFPSTDSLYLLFRSVFYMDWFKARNDLVISNTWVKEVLNDIDPDMKQQDKLKVQEGLWLLMDALVQFRGKKFKAFLDDMHVNLKKNVFDSLTKIISEATGLAKNDRNSLTLVKSVEHIVTEKLIQQIE